MAMTVEAQFHVLAVDDSIIDRMLIERLLKTSSFHGTFFLSTIYFISFNMHFYCYTVKGFEKWSVTVTFIYNFPQ